MSVSLDILWVSGYKQFCRQNKLIIHKQQYANWTNIHFSLSLSHSLFPFSPLSFPLLITGLQHANIPDELIQFYTPTSSSRERQALPQDNFSPGNHFGEKQRRRKEQRSRAQFPKPRLLMNNKYRGGPMMRSQM